MPDYTDPFGDQYNGITTGAAETVDMRWAGIYDVDTGQGTRFGPPWPQASTIRDQSWLMVANKYTTDRPAPQPQAATWGLTPEPTYTAGSDTGWVSVANRYTLATPVQFNGFRVWLQANSVDYEITAFSRHTSDATGLTAQVGSMVIPTSAATGEWVEILIPGDAIYFPGDVVEVGMIVNNTAGETVIMDAPWGYACTHNNTPPVAGD